MFFIFYTVFTSYDGLHFLHSSGMAHVLNKVIGPYLYSIDPAGISWLCLQYILPHSMNQHTPFLYQSTTPNR